jgi:signal transduction histidine kinase
VRVPLEVGNAWYKITEHALENAVRHSKASKIEVTVKPGKKGPLLEIRDTGTGFVVNDAREHSGGLGLLLMDHYANQAGIDLTFTSVPGKGTTIRSISAAPVDKAPVGVADPKSDR